VRHVGHPQALSLLEREEHRLLGNHGLELEVLPEALALDGLRGVGVALHLRHLVLPVRVQEPVVARDELDLGRLEEQTELAVSTEGLGVDLDSPPLLVDDLLVVEVLDGSEEVLAGAEGDDALTLAVAPELAPDVGQHELLLLLGDGADEPHHEEDLGELGAGDLELVEVVDVLGLVGADEPQLHGGELEVLVELVVDDLVRGRVDLVRGHPRLLAHQLVVLLLLLHAATGVLVDRVEVPLDALRLLVDLGLEGALLHLVLLLALQSPGGGELRRQLELAVHRHLGQLLLNEPLGLGVDIGLVGVHLLLLGLLQRLLELLELALLVDELVLHELVDVPDPLSLGELVGVAAHELLDLLGLPLLLLPNKAVDPLLALLSLLVEPLVHRVVLAGLSLATL